ncbi:hypothetical protein ACFWWX_19320, partial [Streptomyces niveus]
MALRPVQVNIKAVDDAAVGRFWAEALGWSAYRSGGTTYVGPAGGAGRAAPRGRRWVGGARPAAPDRAPKT